MAAAVRSVLTGRTAVGAHYAADVLDPVVMTEELTGDPLVHSMSAEI
ncbi:hypothetical protein HEB94_000275 [Actinopolymorpha pittospori]|uniref:Uncharacterized protein n=1 Tax=Actinopolymorpha pittospori TaxID=648752 RepID=A0A927MNV7_9ACTN|nr:hypothetical protein [Actinopolymorpha pittospori]